MSIYENLKKAEQIHSISQIEEDINNYEKYFKVEKGDVIVDIGAHIGLFSKKHYDTASKIYMIEPDPIFNSKYNTDEKTTVIKAGISSNKGEARIKSDGNANFVNALDGVCIETIDFKSFISDYNISKIDFLKIDCEGGEYHIFKEDNLDWIKENCNKIAGEFHIHNNKQRTLLPYVLLLLEEKGFDIVLTSIDGTILTKKHLLESLNYYTEINFFILTKSKIDTPSNESITVNYVDGAYVNITSDSEDDYQVRFVDKDSNKILHIDNIKSNQWTRCFFKYFIDWEIQIDKNGVPYKKINLDLKDKRVLIGLASSSLGDTLAWFPYIDEFRKKHNCEVIASTFMNSLFKDQYPNIQFAEPGEVVNNITAKYDIGWFYNGDNIDLYKMPVDPKTEPMQKTASNILGLEYKEIKPLLKLPNVEKEKLVTIGIHSTAQIKYWLYPNGWQTVVDYIKSEGYKPLLLSKESDGYMGNKHPEGLEQLPQGDISKVIEKLCSSKLFVGVGSGLSWLAWACNVPVVLISGFSEPYTEMSDCLRVSTPEGFTTGCFNRHKLDPSDWNWDADHKGTDRQFECSTSIKPETVIDKIKSVLNG